jgi:hypothetical protein
MRRYPSDQPIPGSALYAWQELGNSVYQKNPLGAHSLMLHRPALDRGQGVSNKLECIFMSKENSLCFL